MKFIYFLLITLTTLKIARGDATSECLTKCAVEHVGNNRNQCLTRLRLGEWVTQTPSKGFVNYFEKLWKDCFFNPFIKCPCLNGTNFYEVGGKRVMELVLEGKHAKDIIGRLRIFIDKGVGN